MMDGQGGQKDNEAVALERKNKAITTAKLLLHNDAAQYFPDVIISATEEDFGKEDGPGGLLRNNKLVHLKETNDSGTVIVRRETGEVSVYRYEPDKPIKWVTLRVPLKEEIVPDEQSHESIDPKFPKTLDIKDPNVLLKDLHVELEATVSQPQPDAFKL